jgi:hypothetical protein
MNKRNGKMTAFLVFCFSFLSLRFYKDLLHIILKVSQIKVLPFTFWEKIISPSVFFRGFLSPRIYHFIYVLVSLIELDRVFD